MGQDKDLENAVGKDRIKTGYKHIIQVVLEESKTIQAEFEEEKQLHEKEDELEIT